MEDHEIIKMLEESRKEQKERNEYINANLDEFIIRDIEYVDENLLPGMFWKIHAIPVDSHPQNKTHGEEKLPLVRLEWGWTAGMSEEDMENYAEDAPSGKEEIYINWSSIKNLRDDLTKIIDKYSNKEDK